jgi:outer membrane protein assembly factor BamB
MTTRKKLLLGAGVVLAVLVAAGAVFALTRPPQDVSNPDVAFEEEPTVTPVPTEIPEEPKKGSKKKDPLENFVWGTYGYSKDRRKFMPASKLLRPPYWRVWSYTGSVLLEFSPAMAEGKLFLLKNNGALHAINKRTGKAVWKKKLGVLAAASPAYGNGRIFVPILARGKRKPGAVYALEAKTGKILWKRLLPSRSESSPVFDNDRIYLGSENGTVYSIRAGDGAVRWKFKASGAVKSGLALADGKLYFGDYSGRVYAIRQTDGHEVWNTGTKGGAFGLKSGTFYSTPAVANGRVFVGNTDGRMYSFSSANGKLAWTKGTGSYVYSSPAVGARPGRQADRLLRLLRRSLLRRRRAQRQAALELSRRRQDLRRRDRDRRHRLLLQLRQEVDDRARRQHGQEGLHDGPRRLQPGHLRRAHDLPDRLLEPVRAQAAEGRIGNPAAAIAAFTSAIVCVP